MRGQEGEGQEEHAEEEVECQELEEEGEQRGHCWEGGGGWKIRIRRLR